MTALDYLPGTGTIAARAVAYLHSLPRGTEVGTGTIAEALDVDLASLIGTVGASINAGLLEREKIGSRYVWRAGHRSVDREFIDAHPPKRHVEIRPFVAPPMAAASPEPATPASMTRLTSERIIDAGDEDAGRTLTPAEIAALGLRAAASEPAPVSSVPEPPIADARRVSRAPAPPVRELRVGLWSDGSIAIERAGRVETYTPDEATQLMRFFDRFLMRGRDAA